MMVLEQLAISLLCMLMFGCGFFFGYVFHMLKDQCVKNNKAKEGGGDGKDKGDTEGREVVYL